MPITILEAPNPVEPLCIGENSENICWKLELDDSGYSESESVTIRYRLFDTENGGGVDRCFHTAPMKEGGTEVCYNTLLSGFMGSKTQIPQLGVAFQDGSWLKHKVQLQFADYVFDKTTCESESKEASFSDEITVVNAAIPFNEDNPFDNQLVSIFTNRPECRCICGNQNDWIFLCSDEPILNVFVQSYIGSTIWQNQVLFSGDASDGVGINVGTSNLLFTSNDSVTSYEVRILIGNQYIKSYFFKKEMCCDNESELMFRDPYGGWTTLPVNIIKKEVSASRTYLNSVVKQRKTGGGKQVCRVNTNEIFELEIGCCNDENSEYFLKALQSAGSSSSQQVFIRNNGEYLKFNLEDETIITRYDGGQTTKIVRGSYGERVKNAS